MNTPNPKRQKVTSFDLCLICQEHDKRPSTKNPELDSIKKLINCAKERHGYGELLYADLYSRTKGTLADDLHREKVQYHRHCFQNLTNKANIKAAKDRYERAKLSGDISEVTSPKFGRRSKVNKVTEVYPSCDEDLSQTRVTRKSVKPFNNLMCAFCQEERSDYTCHEVMMETMGERLKRIVKSSNDEHLKIRLIDFLESGDPKSGVAYDIKYHLPCLVNAERSSMATNCSDTSSVILPELISNIELVEILEAELNQPGAIIDMNTVNRLYIDILSGNKVPNVKADYKKKLKSIIKENFHDNITFNHPSYRRKPMQILSTKTKENIISGTEGPSTGDQSAEIRILLQAAKIIRNDITKNSDWKFTGSFQDYKPPPLTFFFCKHAIQGTRSIHSERKDEEITKNASIITQTLVQSMKTNRQMSYVSKGKFGHFYIKKETPISVALPLTIHRKTRSKSLVHHVSTCFNFTKYPRIFNLENRIAAAVCKKISNTGGVYLPPFTVQDRPIYFATDNIDFCEATPDGSNTLHGTIITLFQKQYDDGHCMVDPLYIDPKIGENFDQNNFDAPMISIPTETLMQLVPEKFDLYPYNSLENQG